MISINDLLGSLAKPLAKPRNTFLDRCFYDLKALSPSELMELSMVGDQEGTVIVVPPTKAGSKIRCYESATHMLQAERDTIGGIAIAGMGSTVVGTAAFARSIADTYGIDVAGIVSGYGAADLMAEAMGGWFFYGYLDRFRRHIAILIEKGAQLALPAISGNGQKPPFQSRPDSRNRSIPRQLDSGTLLDILAAHPRNLKILVGHSKGALLIEYVLDEFVRRAGDAHPLYDDLQVVTVSAVVGLPPQFKKTSQIIGNLDWFGGINSLPELLWEKDHGTRPKYIENALHHLNTEIPFELCLPEALGAHVPLR